MSQKNDKPCKLLDIEFYLATALEHGENSDPDHEVGDLQDYLRVMWQLLTPSQQHEFAKKDIVHSTLECGLGLDDFDRFLKKEMKKLNALTPELGSNIMSATEVLADINAALVTTDGGTLADIHNQLYDSVITHQGNLKFEVLPEYSDELKDRLINDGWSVQECMEYHDLWDWTGPEGQASEYSFDSETEAWFDMITSCNIQELYPD